MSTTDPARTRATVRQYTPDESSHQDTPRGAGWLMFAGVMLVVLATLNVVDGIAAVSNSSFFVDDAKFILSGLNTWGWVMIALGVAQGLTAIGVWLQTPGARWVGVTVAALNAMAQMFFLPAYPFWSLTLFALDLLVIYGLIAYGARESRTA